MMKAMQFKNIQTLENNPLVLNDVPIPAIASDEIPVKTGVKLLPLEEANKALQLLKPSKINDAGV
jgi:hypothetical protein